MTRANLGAGSPERIFVVGNSAIDMLRYTIRADYRHQVR